MEKEKAAWMDTPIGRMVAIAREDALCFLGFEDRLKRDKEMIFQQNHLLRSFFEELHLYFQGLLKSFQTPFFLEGTPFQKKVWEELTKIPYGQTLSYAEIGKRLGHPKAYRAVAQANRANPLSILIPCHRVLYASGKIGGYRGGIPRKSWLLDHEKKNLS